MTKKYILIFSVLLLILTMAIFIPKALLISQINSLENNDVNNINLDVYLLDEVTNDENKIKYQDIEISIPNKIDYNEADCETYSLGYKCTKNDKIYFSILNKNSEDKELFYTLKLAYANTTIKKHSLFSSIKELEALLLLNKISLIAPINKYALFMTYGTQNVIFAEIKENDSYQYIIDNYMGNSVMFRSKTKLTTEEALSLIKTIKSNSNFTVKTSPDHKYSLEEAYNVILDKFPSEKVMKEIIFKD